MIDTPAQPAIKMVKVSKFFGEFQALKDIDLEVYKGEKIVICDHPAQASQP